MSVGALGARHQRVQRLRRLIRRSSVRQSERAFVAEGIKVVTAALDAGAPVEGLYLAAAWRESPVTVALVERAQGLGIRAYELGPGIMERVADTVTPQALCAVVGAIDRDLGALLDRGLVLVCVDVRDPGNLGAVLRSAAAAGADGVICCSGTVDLYNPKAVRSSAGALFQVPIAIDAPIADALSQLATAGYRCWATVVRGGVDYTEADLAGATALVLGNEAAGLPDQVVARLGGSLTIPMASATESLNVAMTAAVLSFEAARQRRASSAAG